MELLKTNPVRDALLHAQSNGLDNVTAMLVEEMALLERFQPRD